MNVFIAFAFLSVSSFTHFDFVHAKTNPNSGCTIPLPHLMEGAPGELGGRIGTIAMKDFKVYLKTDLKSKVLTSIKKGVKIRKGAIPYTLYTRLATVRVKKNDKELNVKKGELLSPMGAVDDVSSQYCKGNKLIEINYETSSEILEENQTGKQEATQWIKVTTLKGEVGFVYGPDWSDGLEMFDEPDHA